MFLSRRMNSSAHIARGDPDGVNDFLLAGMKVPGYLVKHLLLNIHECNRLASCNLLHRCCELFFVVVFS